MKKIFIKIFIWKIWLGEKKGKGRNYFPLSGYFWEKPTTQAQNPTKLGTFIRKDKDCP